MAGGTLFFLAALFPLRLEGPVKAPVIIPAPQPKKYRGPNQNQDHQPVAPRFGEPAGEGQDRQNRQQNPAGIEKRAPERQLHPIGGADKIILYMDVPGLLFPPIKGGFAGEQPPQAFPGDGQIEPAGEQEREPDGDMAAEEQPQGRPACEQVRDGEIEKC